MNKVNEKLEKSIAAAEEEARIAEERNRVYHERVKEIEKDIAAERELERRFDEIMEVPGEEKEEAVAPVQDASAFSRYLPIIVHALREKAGPAILEVLADVGKLTELARSTYQALPMPIRLVVKEQVFVEWVVSHQGSIVEGLQSQLTTEGAAGFDAAIAIPPSVVEVQGKVAD